MSLDSYDVVPAPVPPVVTDPVVPPAVPGKAVRKAAGRSDERPLWLIPDDAGRRNWMVIGVLLCILGLYGVVMKGYYAGAQGGVDQAGYLMTARMIAGDRNVYTATRPAAATQAAGQAGGQTGATGSTTQGAGVPWVAAEKPAPSGAQTWSGFDFIRNRLSFVPEDPFQFVSRMCVMTEPFGPATVGAPAEYRVYAKYPFGYPLFAAIFRMFFGLDGMYFVNPLCTVAACYFAYFLFRQAVSPFMSLLGVIWVACNPLVLYFSNDANSHSSTLMCIMIGFWGLLSWMRTQQNWRAWVGGLALGYACTIRYSEFLMVLPVLFAALVNLKWERKRVLGSLSLVAAWAIPVGVLAIVCWVSFGAPWKTGYTYCRESTGFAWKYFSGDFGDPNIHKTGNWETLITQLNHTGLFVLWPLALAGLFAMMGSTWRLGMTVALWVLPQTVLYLLYYWAPGGEATVSYLRFFMTVVPGMILAGLWLLERGLVHLRGEKRAALIGVTAFGLLALVVAALVVEGEPLKGGLPLVGQVFGSLWHMLTMSWQGFVGTVLWLGLIAGIWVVDREHAATKVGMAMGAGVITAVGCAMNVYNIMPRVDMMYTQSVGLRETVDRVREILPRGSVLIGDDNLLNQLDCVGEWKLVNGRMFTQSMFQEAKRRLENLDKDKDLDEDPNPIQPERSRFIMELLGKQDAKGVWVARPAEELVKWENEVIDRNFAEGRRVAFLMVERDTRPARMGRMNIPQRKDCELKELGRWVNQPAVSVAPGVVMGRNPGRAQRVAPQGAPPRSSGMYVVMYELVKKPVEVKAAEKKVSKPAALPAARPAATQKTIFDF